MAKKEKKVKESIYYVPKHQPFYKFIRLLMPLIFKKPKKIINMAGDLNGKGLIVCNHSAKSGPPALTTHFPVPTAQVGAYEMLGDYKTRRAYLHDVLYIKKLGKKPGLGTSIKCSIMARLSLKMYRGMRIIPSFPDNRFKKTLRYTEQVLNEDTPIIIYPENSNEGYKEVLTEFFPGFVMIAENYYRKTGIDIPVYPTYYSLKKRIMVINKPLYVQDLIKQGLNREQIAEKFRLEVNQLYYDYVEKE